MVDTKYKLQSTLDFQRAQQKKIRFIMINYHAKLS